VIKDYIATAEYVSTDQLVYSVSLVFSSFELDRVCWGGMIMDKGSRSLNYLY